jgi:integrase
MRLAALRAQHIERALQQLRAAYPDQSSATRQRAYATLRSALRHAVRSKLIAVSPTDSVQAGFTSTRKRPTVWQPEQVGAFLDHLNGLEADRWERRLAPMYHLATLSGLRRGEVVGLRWSDVDLDNRFLVVSQQAVVLRHRVEYTAPKTKAGEQRILALDADTVAALTSWKAQQAADRLAWGPSWNDTGLAFTREDGTGWHPETLTKTLPKLATAAGVPPIRFHISVMSQPRFSSLLACPWRLCPSGLVTQRSTSQWTATDTCSERPTRTQPTPPQRSLRTAREVRPEHRGT